MSIIKGLCADYYVGYADDGLLEKYCNQLQRSAGEIVKKTDSHLLGTVDAKDEQRLFFTIPYDVGWTLKVDGIETSLEKTADLFMSAPVSAGSHNYELTFFPKGLKTGIMITGGGCILLLILILYNITLKRKKRSVTLYDDNVSTVNLKEEGVLNTDKEADVIQYTKVDDEEIDQKEESD